MAHSSADNSCVAPSFFNQSVYQRHSVPFLHIDAHPKPATPSMQPEVLLLLAIAFALWLLGVVNGLLLPLLLQRASSALWQKSSTADADAADSTSADSASAALQSGLQSRPLSDVDPEEPYDEELLGSHQHTATHQLVATGGAVGLTPHWHLRDADLARFQAAVDPVRGRLLTGDLGGGWNFIMEREQPGRMRYASYWRPTADGKTDYLSITIVHGATAQEMQEFTFDDNSRVRWDPMLKSAWLLQSGKEVAHTCEQVVVWLRSFPMGFVSDRLYAGISRREVVDPQQPGCLWGVSKVVHTPTTAAWAALNYPGVTLTDDYYSAWECRTIRSPWDGTSSTAPQEPQPACALILYHHDDLKVPEYLARTAIKLGMWKFVQGMVGYADKWLQQRRARVDPFQPDPQALCRQHAPPLTPDVAAAAAAVAHRHALPSPLLQGAAASTPAASEAMLPPSRPSAAAAAAAAAAAVGDSSVVRSPTGGNDRRWSGFRAARSAEDSDLQPATPRVLMPVPTAPGPLHLMDIDGDMLGADGSSGQGRRGGTAGPLLRRGHSMEWEPRLGSSSSSSTAAAGDAEEGVSAAMAAGIRGQQAAGTAVLHTSLNVGKVLQAARVALQQPGQWGAAAAGAARRGASGVARAVSGGVQWCAAAATGRQTQASPGGDQGSSVLLSPSAAARLPKPNAGHLLAPAGPEGDGAAAEAATAAAVQQQQQQQQQRVAAGHGIGAADFGGQPYSSSAGRHSKGGGWLRLVPAAAAVLAAVIAVNTRRRGVAVTPVEQ